MLLASLTGSQRRKLQDRVRIVQDLLAADDRQLQERTAEMAQAEGMSVRTLERWLKSYREAGPAGLVDARLLRDRPGTVDPRWDVACLAVLREFVSSSTPTMNVVIDRVRERVDEEHGLGVVPMPSRATAYRRLSELSKGRHAFGPGKARRSVANRPGGRTGSCGRPGRVSTWCSTPPRWTCSRCSWSPCGGCRWS